MLSIERKLSTWLTNGLSGDNANWFMVGNWLAGRHIDTVSLAWNAFVTFSSQNALDLEAINFLVSFELLSNFAANELVGFETILLNCFGAVATVDTISEADASMFSFGLVNAEAWVFCFGFNREDILGHIDETTSEVTGVGGTESRRHLTLTCTAGCDEGFERRETLLERRLNWELDFAVVNVHLDTNRSGSKLNVTCGTTSTRVGHDRNVRIETSKVILNVLCDFIVDLAPCINREAIALVFGKETILKLLRNSSGLAFTLRDHLFNFWVVWVVILRSRDTGDSFVLEREILDSISGLDGNFVTKLVENVCHDLLQMLTVLDFVIVWIFLWKNLVEEDATKGSITLDALRMNTNWGLKVNEAHIVSELSFVNASVGLALTLCGWFFVSEVVATQHDVLRNRKHWSAIGWLQEVLAGSHEFLCFSLCFGGKWKVDSHLVTIVVGVETVCDEWMELDCLTFDELWLEGLDRETVERWCAVEEDILAFDNLVECIPNHSFALLDQARCRTNVVCIFILNKPRDDEWLEEFKCHLLWQTTLVNAEFWTDDNHGAARVVNALTKKVLAEATLLTLEEVRKALQLATTVLGSSGAATTASVIVDKSIDSFLEHALLVAADNFWRIEVNKLLQAVVAVNNAAIEIVQIGGCKAATSERNHRA